jgi:hypothetical protein
VNIFRKAKNTEFITELSTGLSTVAHWRRSLIDLIEVVSEVIVQCERFIAGFKRPLRLEENVVNGNTMGVIRLQGDKIMQKAIGFVDGHRSQQLHLQTSDMQQVESWQRQVEWWKREVLMDNI